MCPTPPSWRGHLLTALQEKQRRKAPVSIHTGGAYTFRTDRMSEAAGIPALCRQATGLPGHHAVAGREPGGFDPGHELATKVRCDGLQLAYHADGCLVISIIPTSTSSVSPYAPSETLPLSRWHETCSRKSRPSYPAPTPTYAGKLPFAP